VRGLAAFPRRCQQTHAQHPLGRAQEIDSTRDRPPAIPGGLEKTEAAQPFLAGEWRRIGIEAAADDFEAQQRQPVFQPVERDEIAVPRRRLRAAEIPLGAVQRKRIETGDHDLALGPDDAIGLAQHQVRVVGEFQRVRQDDEVQRVFRERQPVRIRDHFGGRVVVERPARRDPALCKERAFGKPDLYRVEAEDIRDRLIEIRLFAREQVGPQVRGKPLSERR
jgi:hypothetical protein